MEYDINGFCEIGTFTNCTNKANITANCRTSHFVGSSVSGISSFGTFKNCKNSGTISLTGFASSGETLHVAGISAKGTHTGCSNSGTIKLEGMVGSGTYSMYAAVVSSQPDKISSCSNSGKVTVTNQTNNEAYAAGVAADYGVETGYVCTKCFNTGAVSIKQQGGRFWCGGVFAYLGGWVRECYNTGKVTGKKGSKFVGGILGSYDNGIVNLIGKYYIYDNYSTTSLVYGDSMITWKEWDARGKKVSTITSKSCPKLSSKYWTYSSKHKRLILKNNKEK